MQLYLSIVPNEDQEMSGVMEFLRGYNGPMPARLAAMMQATLQANNQVLICANLYFHFFLILRA